jgi:hypothetical protein
MLKKQINIVLPLDFDIHGFFGRGIHHKLFLTFHLAICAVQHKNLHSLFHRTLHFHVWRKLTTQWSNKLLFNEYWMQLMQNFHVCSVLLSLNIQSNSIARSPGVKLKMSLKTYWPDLAWPESEGSNQKVSELLYIFIIPIDTTTCINTIQSVHSLFCSNYRVIYLIHLPFLNTEVFSSPPTTKNFAELV